MPGTESGSLLHGGLIVLPATLPATAQQEGASSGIEMEAQRPDAAPLASVGSADQALKIMRVGSQSPRSPNRAALGDVVIVEIERLDALLNPDSQVSCSDLVLFLDGIAIQGSPPESCSPGEGRVRFLLDRTDESDQAWRTLLAEPAGFTKAVSVSVGTSTELAYPTSVQDFELEVLPRTELLCYLGILAIGIALLVRLVRKTSLLREPGSTLEGQPASFSLSRFQFAFWSILVIAAYVFIWMLTEELDTITGSVLVLLSIGAGTALGSTLIDSGKEAVPATAPPSKGFLNDLLSDDQGISLHRFQLFAWTLVLGVIFCTSVYDGLQMPQFSTTLLGLMGLSSGTYLGFKVPEGKTPGQTPG